MSIVTTKPDMMGGQPTIRGMRITVVTVVSLWASGHDDAKLLDNYPYLSQDDLDGVRGWLASRAGMRWIADTHAIVEDTKIEGAPIDWVLSTTQYGIIEHTSIPMEGVEVRFALADESGGRCIDQLDVFEVRGDDYVRHVGLAAPVANIQAIAELLAVHIREHQRLPTPDEVTRAIACAASSTDSFATRTLPPPRPAGPMVWPSLLGRLGPEHAGLRREMEARRDLGVARYGQTVHRDDGRPLGVDALQEALDLLVYLERDAMRLEKMGALRMARTWVVVIKTLIGIADALVEFCEAAKKLSVVRVDVNEDRR